MMKKSIRVISLTLIIVVAFCFLTTGCTFDEGEFTSNEGLYSNITPGAESTESTEQPSDSGNSEEVGNPEDNSDDVYEYIEPDKATAVHATINVKYYGAIKLELYTNIAPITVENFVNLAKNGFYDGLTFHRVISGFVIQGGDPKGDGTGGSDKNIVGEFLINGINNPLSHKRGVISMARNSYDYNSASSQFFICHQDNPDSLDGQYAGFGIVTAGMDVVDAIAMVETDGNDKPKADVIIESIKIDS